MVSNDGAPALAADRSDVPLVVDLDGTLLRGDLLIECAFARVGETPLAIFALLNALRGGKAALKHRLSDTEIDVALLPYDADVMARITAAKAEGRQVYLASASHERLVEAVAGHVGLFDGWIGTTAALNLAGPAKAEHLRDRFGPGGFDYIGNDKVDLQPWTHARKRIGIRLSASTARQLRSLDPDAEHMPSPRASARTWLRLLRVHQWAKNALLLVPLVTAHAFTLSAFLAAVVAIVAFSLAASAIYIVNDLVDLGSDRQHPTKRKRPLAAGLVPPMQAVLLVPVLLAASGVLGLLVSPAFAGILLFYLVLTTSYSFALKRKFLLDVVMLASLYTLRVVAGAVAIDVAVSEWFIAFSMFIFTSLALVKRYTELLLRADAGLPDSASRNYRTTDAPIVLSMAASAGFNAVTVLALYVASSSVDALYSRPKLLWLICPILMYWIGRAIMLAHRRIMDDDPIIFALKDKVSYVALAAAGLIILLAI